MIQRFLEMLNGSAWQSALRGLAAFALSSGTLAFGADPRPRLVADNVPRLVTERDDGRVVLFPETAEFYGSEIRINPDNHCIAWWSKPADFVAWEIELAAPREFELWLEWAISDELAGNPFVVEAGGKKLLSGTVLASGGWTQMKREPQGKLQLPAGRSRLALRPGPTLRGELADVRAVTLNPVGAARPPAAPPIPARTPAASLNSIHVHPAMQVELVAAEPLVRDPIAIAWGADLRLWVVEMVDYPLGVDGQGKSGGRVKVLEDVDGDGRYDRATLFLDGLGFPTAVLPWRKGVLVACAPEIFYAEDTDGDGRADLRKPLFTGFLERNQQHRVNGLRLGLDNWVYCANGDGGVGGDTVIHSVASGQDVRLGSRDFRIQPDTGQIEPQTGPTQFGRNRDDWGNWFGSNNGQPLYHFALDDHYLSRNPRISAPETRTYLYSVGGPFNSLAPTVSFRGEQALPAGPRSVGMSSACSGMIYRDTLLGEAFAGNAFVCDPVTNLVHRRILEPRGATFSSRRADDEATSEFFASSDPWTRPTMIQTGPDGALYVVDMYRLYIEHPQWIASVVAENADLRAGNDMGRIYRISPRDRKAAPARRLDRMDVPALVAALDSPSGWQRDQAQQLLVLRADPAAAPLLTKLAHSSARAATRLQALCTLDGLDRASDELLLLAMHDAHPAVRSHAVRISEPRLDRSPKLAEVVLALADDDSAPVRLQVAYSLGAWNDPRAGKRLGQLIVQNAQDPLIISAALSSSTRQPAAVLSAIVADDRLDDAALARAVNACLDGTDEQAFAAVTRELKSPPTPETLGHQLSLLGALVGAAPEVGARLETLSAELAPLFDAARKAAVAPDHSEAERCSAVRLLARQKEHAQADREALVALVSPTVEQSVAMAAVDRLAELADDSLATALAATLTGQGPALRGQVMSALFARESWLQAFLDYAESHPAVLAFIDTPRRQQLLKHNVAALRERATTLLGSDKNQDRQRVLGEYASALAEPGNADLGVEVFKTNCSACHRLGQVGFEAGPDLAGLKDKSPHALLEAILDPNRAVEDKFMAFVAVTSDGRSLSGIITSETGNGITLVSSDSQTHTILRSDLESLGSTGRSLMPEGFEKTIPPKSMADLLAFLTRAATAGPQPKQIAGNNPSLIQAGRDGALILLPQTAELVGLHVGINPDARCLAWMADGDQAVWSIDVPKAGEYAVQIEWAQIDELDGNAFVVEAGPAKFSANFPTTHGWSVYSRRVFGKLKLPVGRQRLVLRPQGEIKVELSDVREIRLIPAPGAK